MAGMVREVPIHAFKHSDCLLRLSNADIPNDSNVFLLNIISTNKKLIVLPLFVLPTFVYILIVTYLIDVLPFVYLLICISIYIYYIYTLQKTLMVGSWFSSLQLCLRLVAWGIPETQADNFWRSFWSRGRMAS